MRSWLKGQDLQASCHWGREKKKLEGKKKKSRPTKRCSTGFHCLLLALKPMFLQAYGAKLSAIVLLTLPPRQILTVGPMQSHPVGFQLMGSSLRNMQQVAVLLISSPKCMAGWSNRSLIQLLLAHQVWKQDKGCRANPTAQDPLSSSVSELLWLLLWCSLPVWHPLAAMMPLSTGGLKCHWGTGTTVTLWAASS